eukprot:maker-scaffold851_size88925-snap-gene-0.27 protein:Tk09231 transcript:maker-scaffold851_size88925-snap-gene-0.27-mRNA-1 annotation:"cubilin isoform x1"
MRSTGTLMAVGLLVALGVLLPMPHVDGRMAMRGNWFSRRRNPTTTTTTTTTTTMTTTTATTATTTTTTTTTMSTTSTRLTTSPAVTEATERDEKKVTEPSERGPLKIDLVCEMEPHYFSSPNYPNDYDNMDDRVWTLNAPGDEYRVKLEFLDIELQRSIPSLGLNGDELVVYDGENDDLHHFQMDPNIPLDQPLYSRVNALTVHFKTNQRGTRRGFKARYQKVRRGSTCNYMHSVVNLVGNVGHSTMLLESPDFGGVGLYFPYLECIWNITVPRDYRIKLDFLSPISTKLNQDFFTVIESNRTIFNTSGFIAQPQSIISERHHIQVKLTTMFFHRRGGFYAQATLLKPEQSPIILSPLERRVFHLPSEVQNPYAGTGLGTRFEVQNPYDGLRFESPATHHSQGNPFEVSINSHPQTGHERFPEFRRPVDPAMVWAPQPRQLGLGSFGHPQGVNNFLVTLLSNPKLQAPDRELLRIWSQAMFQP